MVMRCGNCRRRRRLSLAPWRNDSVTARHTGETLSVTAIVVDGLRKSYGAVEAVRGISFAVEEGEVFGLLGPNGAGKTSTVEILEGMRTPDRGTARVCGLDPEKSGSAFKQTIGAVLQSTALPDKLKVKEAL